MPRQQRRYIDIGEPAQVTRECVDHAVERLVRHRLALVAAAGEHERAVRYGLVAEVTDERRLADARRALDEHADRAAAFETSECVAEHGQLAAATDERSEQRRLRAERRAA